MPRKGKNEWKKRSKKTIDFRRFRQQLKYSITFHGPSLLTFILAYKDTGKNLEDLINQCVNIFPLNQYDCLELYDLNELYPYLDKLRKRLISGIQLKIKLCGQVHTEFIRTKPELEFVRYDITLTKRCAYFYKITMKPVDLSDDFKETVVNGLTTYSNGKDTYVNAEDYFPQSTRRQEEEKEEEADYNKYLSHVPLTEVSTTTDEGLADALKLINNEIATCTESEHKKNLDTIKQNGFFVKTHSIGNLLHYVDKKYRYAVLNDSMIILHNLDRFKRMSWILSSVENRMRQQLKYLEATICPKDGTIDLGCNMCFKHCPQNINLKKLRGKGRPTKFMEEKMASEGPSFTEQTGKFVFPSIQGFKKNMWLNTTEILNSTHEIPKTGPGLIQNDRDDMINQIILVLNLLLIILAIFVAFCACERCSNRNN